MNKEKKVSYFISFLLRIHEIIKGNLTSSKLEENIKDEYRLAAEVLSEINEFFYQHKNHLEKNYISEFHKYWEANHKKILSPRIDEISCKKVAQVLENIYRNYEIKVQLNTLDLTKEQIANVRFFTAIQDFKIDIGAKLNPFEIYKTNPECFCAEKILDNEMLIDALLRKIGANSQRDKRESWMKKAAQLLVNEYNGSAYNINAIHCKDVSKIKNALVEQGLGFSKKKADMFLRDMGDLCVWEYNNPEEIDVMSDKNTMRIALRTGILKLRIPLLASYLDVYCFQYSLIDKWSSLAWKRVWELWGNLKDNHRPLSPASIDYFIYRIGKIACWKAPSRRRCSPNKPVKAKWIESLDKQDRLIFNNENFCVFNEVCINQYKKLNHPMSISILGTTGWNGGKTNQGGGGGIQS